MNQSAPLSSSKQPAQPYRNRTPLSTGVARPPNPAATLPPPLKIRVQRPVQTAVPVNSPSGGKLSSGTPPRIVKALAWVILAVIVAGATATVVAYVHLRSFQTRLDEVDDWMAAGRDTAALYALREMAEPAARHGLLVREVGTRTVRVLVRLDRVNEAEDTADALATLVPPDDAEPWAFASPRDLISLPQWVAGDTLYGAERMAWDRWAGYRELLASLSARDRVAMENARVLLVARHPNNPLCPGKPKPVIREADNQPDQTIQASQTSQTRQTRPADPKNFAPDALAPVPSPQLVATSSLPRPVPATPAVVTSLPTQESARNRTIRQLRDRQSAIHAQLKSLHAANDSAPAQSSAAQIRLDQHRAEMQKIAQKSEVTSGDTRIRALEQLRQMKYKEMQLQREAGPPQAVPNQQVVALRSELADIAEQLNALGAEPAASK